MKMLLLPLLLLRMVSLGDVVIMPGLCRLVTHLTLILRLLLVILFVVEVLLLLLLLLNLLHLLLLLLLSVLGDAILDYVKMPQNVVLVGRELVGVLQAGLGLQQLPTFHVDDA